MADPDEVEFARVRSVLRGLDWSVTTTTIERDQIVVTAVKSRPAQPTPR